MSKHMMLEDMPEFCSAVQDWLKRRYGKNEGVRIWKAVCQQYIEYLKELPDYGGKKNAHALAIYGSIVIFTMYPNRMIKRTMQPDTISPNARTQSLQKSII